MSHTWFRLYDEVVDDPKVQLLPDRLFKAWINFMCIASKNDPRGTLPRIEDIAYRLHLPVSKATSLLNELIQAGLFDCDQGKHRSHNWDSRQFQSDVSTERVKRFRERSRNVTDNVPETADETDQIQIQNTDTESETDTDTEGAVKYAPDFETFWAVSTKRGSKLEAFKVWKQLRIGPHLGAQVKSAMLKWMQSEQWQDETKQPHVCRWLKRRGWEELVPRSANGQTKVDRTIQNAQRLRDRLDREDRSVGERGVERSDNGRVPGTPDLAFGAAAGASDKPND